YDTEAAEVAILRAERAVNDRDIVNQLGTQRFERTQVSLPVTLRALILLHAVDEYLQSAIHAAVIEVETEAADLQRLAAAFMLSRVDASVELLDHLVVAIEKHSSQID